MNVHVRGLQDYRLLLGRVLLHLSEYKIVGGCIFTEQGTASGASAVTACFPKEVRITLKGKLPPDAELAYIAKELDLILHSGATRVIDLGSVLFQGARLIGYTFDEGADFPELTLLFCSSDPFLREEAP